MTEKERTIWQEITARGEPLLTSLEGCANVAEPLQTLSDEIEYDAERPLAIHPRAVHLYATAAYFGMPLWRHISSRIQPRDPEWTHHKMNLLAWMFAVLWKTGYSLGWQACSAYMRGELPAYTDEPSASGGSNEPTPDTQTSPALAQAGTQAKAAGKAPDPYDDEDDGYPAGVDPATYILTPDIIARYRQKYGPPKPVQRKRKRSKANKDQV